MFSPRGGDVGVVKNIFLKARHPYPPFIKKELCCVSGVAIITDIKFPLFKGGQGDFLLRHSLHFAEHNYDNRSIEIHPPLCRPAVSG